ncbi:zinc finger C3HC4 type domain containing protein [Nitzschia inconspicua]|uniref:RING-type E3 ubiquitin transferase n=1 Tax=Nitzschia inconspicua TaxID=303405 RepID=A0A9K3L2N1_9STRA|nr:zinc finger C3HC4 type domain containing protein [Nitzschia inconspicua]
MAAATATDDNAVSKQEPIMAVAPKCSICLDLAEDRVTLRLCGHEYCGECLETWFLRQERTSSKPPSCPECRAEVHNDDIICVLGRSIRSWSDCGQTETHPDDDWGDTEDFTLTFLQEQGARECPDCGMWIIKDDGCDNIMCRCGCRFCYCCGAKGTCEGGPFYNNFAMLEEYVSYEWDPETESVAGVFPLFLSTEDDDWWCHWMPSEDEDIGFDYEEEEEEEEEEIEDACGVRPLFSECEEYYEYCGYCPLFDSEDDNLLDY